MNLFFQIQSLQILIVCMDHQEYVANLDLFFDCFFFYNIIKANHFLYRFIIFLRLIFSLSLTKSLLVPYAYVSIDSIHWILLSSFELKAILLISSVKTIFYLCQFFLDNFMFKLSCF